jgi:prepilin-type processing-associated H-X9-DG protein
MSKYFEYKPLVSRGSGITSVIPRMRQGIERFLVTDINDLSASSKAAAAVPIFLDNLAAATAHKCVDWIPAEADVAFNHRPRGCNVVYLDGHVEFKRYKPSDDPGSFPVTPYMAYCLPFTKVEP